MRRTYRAAVSSAGAASVVLLGACSDPSALVPRAEEAGRISTLFWVMLAVGTAVFLLVAALLVASVIRSRRESAEERPGDGVRMVALGGVVLPVVVVVPLAVYTLVTASALSAGDDQPVLVDVVGRQFWWEVRYPGHGVVAANEVHIPAGSDVTVRLRSRDVIHSFWAPRLHGKVDLIPGETTSLHISDAEPGVYRGACAEFCGIQHAGMKLLVHVQPPAEFAAWLDDQRQAAAPPAGSDESRGLEVFLRSGCASCHTIRGTDARGAIGPDLTHVASRSTLAAGVIPNTRGHLAGWILDPQSVKPGAGMPPIPLEPDELHALLDYLETRR